jgi:uncharacterized protein YbaP (TraB family)
MFIPRKIICALLLLIPFCASSQKRDQTLLWRITGKGLTKPSYLFGTVHLKDKELFRFSDSVYAAIATTDGFAIEINLNEMIGYYVNKLLDEKDDDKKVKDMLTEKQLNKMREPLSKKFNKNINDITTKDIVKEKNKWMSDYLEKGEMPTIVDAYLYDIARRQGKWLGGIEDVEDQMALMDAGEINQLVDDDKKLTIDSLKHLYMNEDIDGINMAINNFDPAYKDMLLTRRNVKMARRMDSLSAIRPMFFAVGAAHLPGDSGVIKMLRVRGFTVEPVRSDKKIKADDYKFVETPVKWAEVTDAKHLYTVSMPGEPASVNIYGLIEMKFLLELSNLSGFCTMAIVNPSDVSNDTIYNRMAYSIFKRKNYKAPKNIMKDGVSGVEYIDRMDKYQVRMQLFHTGNTTYMACVYGKKDTYLKTADVDRFFNSMKLTPHTEPEKTDYTFSDTTMAISFKSPAVIEPNASLTKQTGQVKDWDASFYTGQDPKTGAYIMVISKQAKGGNYVASDSIVLDDLAGYFKEKYKMDREWTTIDGYRGMVMEGDAKDVYMKALSFVRGNKNITIMLVTQTKDEGATRQQIFSSLRLLPYGEVSWHVAADPVKNYSTYTPSAFKERGKKKDGMQVSYYSFDTLSGTSYNISADTLSKYTWITDDEEFMTKKLKEYQEKDDSIVYKKMMKNGADMSGEVLMRKKRTNVYKRIRAVLHGNVEYDLFAGGDLPALTSANADKFFADFRVTGRAVFDLHKHKGNILFSDLRSGDSATRYHAYVALDYQDFDKDDLSMLHDALFTRYKPIYSWSLETSINESIGNCIAKLNDAATVSYIKENYKKLTGDREKLKYVALTTLASIKTKESYAAIAELMLSGPPRSGNKYTFSRKVDDSLLLLKTIYPSLSKLFADTSVGPMIANLAETLLDSGMITVDDVRRSEQDIILLANAMLIDCKKSDLYNWEIYHVLNLLYKVNTNGTMDALKQFLSAKSMFLRRKTAMLLTERDIKIDPAIWDTLASRVDTRSLTYNDLKKYGKESLFPAAYLKQRYFAEAALYDMATEDDEDTRTAATQIITTRSMLFNGKIYKFYLFKVTFTEDNESRSYLGVGGGYDTDEKDLDPQVELTGIHWADKYDIATLNDQFKDYLKSKEEAEPPKEDIK